MTPDNGTDDGQRDDNYAARLTQKKTTPAVAGVTTGGRGTVGCDRMDKLILGYLSNDPALEPEVRERVVEHLERCVACYGKMLAVQYGMERMFENDD
jgi:hypothetical protein